MNHPLIAASAAGLVLALVLSSRDASADEEPVPEAAPSAAADRPQAEAKEESEEDTDAFRIGVLGGIGFPRPLALEGMIKIGGVLALGVEYSLLPKTTFGSVDTRFWALAADARIFPFKNGFFIGLRAGHQTLSASATATVDAFSLTESATAETWFVNPRIGFLWTWKSGFTVGLDAGVQIPIHPTLDTTLPAGAPTSVDGTIATIANTFGNSTTPSIDLLRVGFLF